MRETLDLDGYSKARYEEALSETPYLDGEKELSECVEELKKATRHYAKRQLTWFGRNEKINWFYSDCYSDPDEMYGQVFSLINNFLGR